jgi:hypothetical protein
MLAPGVEVELRWRQLDPLGVGGGSVELGHQLGCAVVTCASTRSAVSAMAACRLEPIDNEWR